MSEKFNYLRHFSVEIRILGSKLETYSPLLSELTKTWYIYILYRYHVYIVLYGKIFIWLLTTGEQFITILPNLANGDNELRREMPIWCPLGPRPGAPKNNSTKIASDYKIVNVNTGKRYGNPDAQTEAGRLAVLS